MYEMNSGIFETVEEAVRASANAFELFSKFSLRERNNLLTNLRLKLLNHIAELASMEKDETGMGVAKDKALQIERAIIGTLGPDQITREAASDEEGLFIRESFPYGISAALHPINHPVASIINCSIMLLAGGNSVIHLIPKRAEKVSRYTVRLINSYINEICGIPNLSVCMGDNRYEYNREIMEHPDTALIVVTGGEDAVRCALSLKKRVIAAGTANPVAIVDKECDLKKAAKIVAEDISFDNNLLCTSEKCAVVLEEAVAEFGYHLSQEGVFLLNAGQADALMNLVFDGDLNIRKEYVGKDAEELLKAIGVSIAMNGEYKALAFETEVVSPFVV
ncbi:MAG: aldehyde dehydrogenase family protein, partial [Lachnospiraceae bacterium]|nr:aldehyde dehydrogenase family protein [Lachnospiraceae bacterium]